MFVDHLTYQVPKYTLDRHGISVKGIFDLIGMKEVEVQEDTPTPERCNLMWFEDHTGFQLHLIEDTTKEPGIVIPDLGHFCVYVPYDRFKECKDSDFCTRARQDSPRIWLEHPCGIRIEVRESKKRTYEGRMLRMQPMIMHLVQQLGGQPPVTPLMSTVESPYIFPKRDHPPRESGDQIKVLEAALDIYIDRNPRYKDNWRRFGWRGCIFRLRERVERVWDSMWNLEVSDSVRDHDYAEAAMDDLYDLINFAAFTIRAIEEGNRDGSWF